MPVSEPPDRPRDAAPPPSEPAASGKGSQAIPPARPRPSIIPPASSVPFPPVADDEDLAGFDEPPPAPTVFVTDPSVEAARLEWALRARGYSVIDVPLAMLVGRVAVQKPDVVLLDVDAEGALEVAAKVRAIPGGSGLHLVYVGTPGRTFSSPRDAYTHDGSGFSPRPLDVEALVRKIDSLVGTGEEHKPAQPVSSPPPSLRAPLSPLPPHPVVTPPSTGAPRSDRGASPSLPIMAPLSHPASERPAPASGAGSAPEPPALRAPEARMSPDLERLLREAEAKLGGPSSHRVSPSMAPPTASSGGRAGGASADYDEVLSPEQEVEAVLPAEVLASLEVPLDDEDDAELSGGTGGGTPRGSTNLGRSSEERAASGRAGGADSTGGGTAAGRTPPGDGARSSRTHAGTTGAHAMASFADANKPAVEPENEADVAHPQADASASHADERSSAAASAAATTPKPPRRAPEGRDLSYGAATGAYSPASLEAVRGSRNVLQLDDVLREPGEAIDERSESQHDHPARKPAPAEEHAPPLAPKTARPPALVRPPEPEPSPPVAPALPPARAVTSADDALRAIADAVAARVSGVLRIDEAAGIRRIVLQDGDVVTAASSVEGESLIGFLVGRGDLPADLARKLEGRVPPFGRLAGAALVAHGHVHKDSLWDTLQAHAAFLLVRAVSVPRARISFEAEPPQRLRGEPPVFGGTPGPALVVEIVRRAVSAPDALSRLGGDGVRISQGSRRNLLDECGLDDEDYDLIKGAQGEPLRALLEARGEDTAPLVYALVALGIIEGLSAPKASAAEPEPHEAIDPARDAELDDASIRSKIMARRALVDDGDYFAILGVPRSASGYEIRRAYLELRRSLEPGRVLLRRNLADLEDDLRLLLDVADEAYDILKDPTRRERYRRAIEGVPRQV